MAESMLSVSAITTGYGATNVLHDVTVEVNKGEIVTLIGGNGAGKTTLLMSFYGNPAVRRGTITFCGEKLNNVPTHKIAERGIALVPEGRRIFPSMTIVENLRMGAFRRSEAEISQQTEHVFHLFPRLKERMAQRAGTMSGGEQQMLAIGRALMAKPQLLLLDEPSLGLAPLIVKQIFETIAKVAADGMTVFLVEQNANQALKLAHRGYVLVNGEIKLAGTGSELRQNPEVRKAYLGEM